MKISTYTRVLYMQDSLFGGSGDVLVIHYHLGANFDQTWAGFLLDAVLVIFKQ